MASDMQNPLDHLNETVKHFVDTASIATVVGTLTHMLPSIAALFSIVWSAIRIYETETIQSWIKKDDDE
jgi:glycerol-3-phosphate acyltransferase PlsY